MGVANFFCLWVALKVFDIQPHLALDWVQSCSLSVVIAWGVQDPLVILLRNNLRCTAGAIRSTKYQTIEKFIVVPVQRVIDQMF